MMSDLDKILTGIEVQEAATLTVDYILKEEKFMGRESAYSYWAGLDDTQKIQILLKALRQK